MPEETIKTGIYLNPQTNCLYFVVGLLDNKDTDTKSVQYFPLYKKSIGCCRSLAKFFEKELPSGEKITRMVLLREMDKKFKDRFIWDSEVFMPQKHVVCGGGCCVDGQAQFMFVRFPDQKEIVLTLDEYLIWI